MEAKATGKVVYLYNDRADCICCEGKHVFSRYIRLDPPHLVPKDFIWDVIKDPAWEGKRVEVVIREIAE